MKFCLPHGMNGLWFHIIPYVKKFFSIKQKKNTKSLIQKKKEISSIIFLLCRSVGCPRCLHYKVSMPRSLWFRKMKRNSRAYTHHSRSGRGGFQNTIRHISFHTISLCIKPPRVVMARPLGRYIVIAVICFVISMQTYTRSAVYTFPGGLIC